MNFSISRARFQHLAKECSWIVAGQISAVLGALVLVRVLTNYLEPAQYGELALGLTVAALFNQAGFGSISGGIIRYYVIAAEKNDLPSYLRASREMMAYVTIVVVAIGLVSMVCLLFLDYTQWIGLAAAGLGFTIFSGYNLSLIGIQNTARKRRIASFHTGLDPWMKILLSLSIMVGLGISSATVMLAYALSSLLMTCSQLYFLPGLSHPQVTTITMQEHENWKRQIWLYSWPFATWGAFIWVQQASDRWALQTFATTQEVGLYSVLFQLGYAPIGLLTGVAITFLSPILYQRSGSTEDRTRNTSVHRIGWSITYTALVMTALAVVFTASQHELIFRLFVASNYHSVSYLLPWMVMAGGLFAASQMLLVKLQSEFKHMRIFSVKITTAIIGTSLNVYGASQYGLHGVVIATLTFSLITFLWMSWLSQHPALSSTHPSVIQ
jgi:O-antigen/teichoic acid export membrane protein